MEALSNAPSLLNFLDAPVVVADPLGKAVFLNPAFELAFCITRDRVLGHALAEIFEGGEREAVLGALAATCTRGQSVRFRIRHQQIGFLVLASPIAVDGQRVGAVLLLTEEPLESEGLHRIGRELNRATVQLEEAVDHLARSDADLGADERADWVASAQRALTDVERQGANLDRMAQGQELVRNREAVLDPARVMRDALAGVALEVADCGVSVDVLSAPDLPLVRGDGKRLQEALETLLRARLAQGPSWLTLAARRLEEPGSSTVVVALTDPPPEPGRSARSGLPAPPGVFEAVEELGGTLEIDGEADQDRTTAIHLPAV